MKNFWLTFALVFLVGVATGAAMLSVAAGIHVRIEPSRTLDSRDLIRLP